MNKYLSIDTFFQILCVISTICLGSYVIYQYILDEDLTEVSFKKFHEDDESIYPEISVCLTDAYLDNRLKQLGAGINGRSYRKFLNGEHWDDRMAKIDYDNVTLDIKDYLIETCIRQKFKDGHCKPFNAKISTFVHQIRKCFTINNPDKTSILFVEAKLNSTLFPSSIRPAGSKFLLRFSFRHQLFRSATSTFLNWPDRINASKSFLMDFRIRNTHVLRRRQDKPSNPCFAWNDYDQLVFEDMIKEVGCKPMYWNKPTSLSDCKEKEKMKMFVDKFYERYFPIDQNLVDIPPCLEVQYVKMDYKDLPANNLETRKETIQDNQDDWFKIRLWYRSPTFMEIKQVKAYCFESVVGNGGGYVGLFLGYSLVQLPNLIKYLFSMLHQHFGNNEEKSVGAKDYKSRAIIQISSYDSKGDDSTINKNELETRICSNHSRESFNRQDKTRQWCHQITKPGTPVLTKSDETTKYCKERIDWK